MITDMEISQIFHGSPSTAEGTCKVDGVEHVVLFRYRSGCASLEVALPDAEWGSPTLYAENLLDFDDMDVPDSVINQLIVQLSPFRARADNRFTRMREALESVRR